MNLGIFIGKLCVAGLANLFSFHKTILIEYYGCSDESISDYKFITLADRLKWQYNF